MVSKIYINRPQQDGGAPKPIIVVETAVGVHHYFYTQVAVDGIIYNDPTKYPSVWIETDQPVCGWEANDLTGSDGIRRWVELPPGNLPPSL